jgi:hypothetical protein
MEARGFELSEQLLYGPSLAVFGEDPVRRQILIRHHNNKVSGVAGNPGAIDGSSIHIFLNAPHLTALQVVKESPGRDGTLSPGKRCIVLDPNEIRDSVVMKRFEPCLAHKLPVSHKRPDAVEPKDRIKRFQKIKTFCGIGAPRLVKLDKHKRQRDPLADPPA